MSPKRIPDDIAKKIHLLMRTPRIQEKSLDFWVLKDQQSLKISYRTAPYASSFWLQPT
jgi:hypothetical protein